MNASGMLNTCKSNVVVSIEDDRDPENFVGEYAWLQQIRKVAHGCVTRGNLPNS